MANTTTSNALEIIRNLTENPPTDRASREELYRALKKLSTVIEDPHDTIYKVIHSPKVLTVARIAAELKIFQNLVNSSSAQVSELAEKTGCDVVLTGRILRYLASHEMVDEVKEDTFAANPVTNTLAVEGFQAGIKHGFDFMLPVLSKTQEFFKKTNYSNPINPLDTPFQIAYHTDQHAIVYGMGIPNLIADFSLWMTTYHADHKSWLDAFDFASHCRGSNENTVVFVDIGGGIGHQCALLKNKLPEVNGRVVLQDQAPVLEHAVKVPGVELQRTDMWERQEVEGARGYYMRSILHDYPDERCIELLKLTAAAMSKDSILFIDEIIIPNVGAHPRATELDVEMMVTLASVERTEKQWDSLIAAAGFEIHTKKTYIEGSGESIIAVIPSKI